MTGRRISWIGMAACAIVFPAWLFAQAPTAPPPALAAGIARLEAREFLLALMTLNEVVAPGSKADQATVARAHAYRAVAFMGLEQPEWAKEAALLSLKADPAIVIDAAAFGPRVAALFETARRPAGDSEAAGRTAEAAGRFQDAFIAYLSAFRLLPEPPVPADDQRLRERIINVVAKLEPKPTVPEEARSRLAKAEELLGTEATGAPSNGAAEQAALELRKAVRIAPWWPDAIVRLATTLQRSGRFDDALINLKLYRLADPEGYAASLATSATPAPSTHRIAAADPEPSAAGPAIIYVYFPHAVRSLGGKSKVLCDGQMVADLPDDRYIVLNAAPGFHLVEIRGRKVTGSFEGGKDHYIRVGIEGYPAHFALRVTDPIKAAAEMREKQVLLNESKNTFSSECTAVAVAPRARTSR